MLPPRAPRHILTIAASLALLLLCIFYYIATHQPWLGITLQPAATTPGGLVVAIDTRSPNTALAPGDVIVGLARQELVVPFYEYTLYDDDVALPTFASFNRFVTHHRELWHIIRQGHFEFMLADGRRVPGQAAAQRPGSDLSWRFWYLAATGGITFLIGAMIWAFQPKQIATRLVLLGTSGYFYAALLAALHSSHELTLPPLWFYLGIGVHNAGIEIVAYSLLALLWHYPRPLARFPAATLCILITVAICANEMLQWIEWPGNTYLMQFPFAFSAMLILAIIKWRQTRHNATDHASLQWFLLTILIGAGSVVILFFVPIAYTGKPILPAVIAYTTGPLIYLGLAFGIARYRLFDIERWWLEVWMWLAGGALVIFIDIILINLADLTNMLALGFALILAGWIYLPIRQWLFRRTLRPSRTRLDDHLPLLVDTLFADATDVSFAQRWRMLLARIFQPLSINTLTVRVPQAEMVESGQALYVPSLDGSATYELRFRERGHKLYTPRDAIIANTLLGLLQRAAELWQTYEKGIRTERQRIMRDLHDDVAARLLSLVHRGTDSELQSQARDTLGALRQVIYALDDTKPMSLTDFLIELQASVRTRLQDTTTHLHWLEPAVLPEFSLAARQRLNLTRVMQEALCNAMRHAAPENISVNCEILDNSLRIQLCNDGVILRSEDWQMGKGTSNIRTRMAEIGGNAEWNVISQHQNPAQLCCLQINFPLVVHA